MNPLISIIIPSYQHASTLPACLTRIFAQTYTPLEIIVIDDGSTDGTQQAVAPFRDRINYVRQENSGANVARNNGFAESKGDYVIFCDADVIMKPEMIQTMFEALQKNPEAAYAYSAFRFGWKTFSSFPFDADLLHQMNYVTTTSLIRRTDFPGFDPRLKRFQDWDLWLTILERGKQGVFIPEILFTIDNHTGPKRLISAFGQAPSQWRPSIMYRLPWRWIGWKPQVIKKYETAREIIKAKHHL